MTEEEQQYLIIGQSLQGTEQSQMFGKPCFKINGKAFMSFFQNDIVCKLDGKPHKNALSLAGSKLFDPSGKGRPMKAWVQVSFAHHKEWENLAGEAYRLVEKLQK